MPSLDGTSRIVNAAVVEQKEKNQNFLQKLWQHRNYLVIEPLYFFWLAGSTLHTVAVESFPLYKACRVNLGYNEIICESILDQSELQIDCSAFANDTIFATPDLMNLTISSLGFNYTLCKASTASQKLKADVNGIRAPIAAIFPLILVLIAGDWCDRYNKRKPLMIAPILGDALAYICLMVSDFFFEDFSMEFGAYCDVIVSAVFGGVFLSGMAVNSYIAIITPEEDRAFRLGILTMFILAMNIVTQPFSGLMFKYFRFFSSFGLGMLSQIMAILYIIFCIKEVKPAPKKEDGQVLPTLYAHSIPNDHVGVENLGFTETNLEELPSKLQPQMFKEPLEGDMLPLRRSCCRELFDLRVVKDCLRFLLTKRKNNGRMLLFLLIISTTLFTGPLQAEWDYVFPFVTNQLKWNGNDYSFYQTYSIAAPLIGIFIGTTILGKLLKFSDAAIGVLSSVTLVISHLLFAFSRDGISFYTACTFDMFNACHAIATQTIGTKIVGAEELSKMFSLLSASEIIPNLFFPPIYSEVNKSTLETFPSAFYLFSEIFFVPNLLILIICYFILRRNKEKTTAAEAIKGGQDGSKDSHDP